jgi:hypothetical protein
MDNSNVHNFRSGTCKKVLDGSICDFITDDKCISSAMQSNRPHVILIFAFHSEFLHRTQEHKSQISYKLLQRVKIAFTTTFTYFHCFLSSGIPFLSEFLHTKDAQVPHSYKLLVRVEIALINFMSSWGKFASH